ncbi:hypothetical protein ACFRQM_00515 [Streptomyces sp. NPDC056831]|uniref:hypothetical protein n=1 Tax=Streptomyces sp. NPDC056831 TaxID=3345954 RepID=UPI003675A785
MSPTRRTPTATTAAAAVATVLTADGHTLVAFPGGVRLPGRAALIPLGVSHAGRRVLSRLAARVGG